ncbi:MAG: hypothetical protein DRJ64_10480, partial [Thermoprotei archaeon]
MNEKMFREFAGYARNNDPSALTVPFSAVIICGDGYKNNYIELVLRNGKTRMYVVPSFFKQLAKMMRVNLSISKTMDEEAFGSLLNALKMYQGSKDGNNDVTVVFDPTIKKLTHISSGGYNRISNGKLFDFAAALVETNPRLKIIEVLGGIESPDTEIRILSSDEVSLSGIESNDPEDFHFGITLSNRGALTTIGDFAYRLVCSNGMMGIRTDDRFKLSGIEQQDMFKLFEHFDTIKKANY